MATPANYVGQLDRRIEIQEPTETRSDSGGVDTSWTAVVRCYAGVAYGKTGNSESVAGDQPVATTRVEFTIRYRTGLTETMRILYAGEYYNMLPPFREIGRRQFMAINAEKQY